MGLSAGSFGPREACAPGRRILNCKRELVAPSGKWATHLGQQSGSPKWPSEWVVQVAQVGDPLGPAKWAAQVGPSGPAKWATNTGCGRPAGALPQAQRSVSVPHP